MTNAKPKLLATARSSVSRARFAAVLPLAPGAIAWAHAASAATVFGPPGNYRVPEAITAAPGGGYLVSDVGNAAIYKVGAGGGAPTSWVSPGSCPSAPSRSAGRCSG